MATSRARPAGTGPRLRSCRANLNGGNIMALSKLKLDDVEVESFETGLAETPSGTVEANQLSLRTCPGQTKMCTVCGMYNCA